MLVEQESTQMNITNATSEAFSPYLTQADKVLIEETIQNPELRDTLQSITHAQKTVIEESITKTVVKMFLNWGIDRFGSKVKEVKIYLTNFIEQHPEVKDADPKKCFIKVVYYLTYCYLNGIPTS